MNSVIVYWLHIKFGVGPALLGPAFGAMSLLAALSVGLSGWIADRITGQRRAVLIGGLFIYLACKADYFRAGRVVCSSSAPIRGCSEIELVQSVVLRETLNLAEAPTLSKHIRA